MNMNEWTVICRVEDIPVLGSRRVARPRGMDVAVFRNDQDQVFALLDQPKELPPENLCQLPLPGDGGLEQDATVPSPPARIMKSVSFDPIFSHPSFFVDE